jgi:hypothetical protein
MTPVSSDAIIRPAGPGSGPTGEKSAVHIGSSDSVLNCCCTAPVTRSVASVPCKRSGRMSLECKDGTRPEQCWFQVRKQSCTLGNFVVNLGNFLYLLPQVPTRKPDLLCWLYLWGMVGARLPARNKGISRSLPIMLRQLIGTCAYTCTYSAYT